MLVFSWFFVLGLGFFSWTFWLFPLYFIGLFGDCYHAILYFTNKGSQGSQIIANKMTLVDGLTRPKTNAMWWTDDLLSPTRDPQPDPTQTM